MELIKVGDLYEKNGQTDFPVIRVHSTPNPNVCGPLGGSSSFYKSVVRYRWDGTAYQTEYVEPEEKIYGSGK